MFSFKVRTGREDLFETDFMLPGRTFFLKEDDEEGSSHGAGSTLSRQVGESNVGADAIHGLFITSRELYLRSGCWINKRQSSSFAEKLILSHLGSEKEVAGC
jgi:hypothetical protein